ncbi:hypothetical protein [Pseudonocardia sp. GCM10023141]|uniref:hypothetical protein n=1 Tax=Pseudonocardia sp. GCM10023141 TaxID=3252653 RepID=UPI00361219FE
MSEMIYAVHTTRPDDVGAVEILFRSQREARSYAKDRSKDFRVLSASVTRYLMGELGTRHPVAWFIGGVEQSGRATRPGGLYPTDAVPAD